MNGLMKNLKSGTKFIFCLNLIVVLCVITGNTGFPIGKMHLVFYAGVFPFLLVLVPLLSEKWNWFGNKLIRHWEDIRGFFQEIFSNRRKLGVILVCLVLIGIVAYGVTNVYAQRMGTYFNLPFFWMCAGIGWCCLWTVVFFSSVHEHPERLFAAIALTAGLCFILASPGNIYICWDDDSHLFRSLVFSDVLMNGGSRAERFLVQASSNITTNEGLLSSIQMLTKARRAEIAARLNGARIEGNTYAMSFHYIGEYLVAYVFYAFGLIISRGLHLPFTVSLYVAKMCNLMFYVYLICKSVKRAENGKLLICFVSLIPTMLFMASNFSYDPWVYGWILYGYVMFFSILRKDREADRDELYEMYKGFFLGCIPKQVYIVLLLPVVFMPRKKFDSRKSHEKYLLWAVLIVLIMAGTNLAPVLLKQTAGDDRGGSNVNASAQLAYILEDPMRYAGILKDFLFTLYLHPLNAKWFIVNYAYVGFGSARVSMVIYVMALILTAIDRWNSSVHKGIWYWFLPVGAILGYILIPTALYLMFTEVGEQTIVGCQFRYMVPLLIPVLMWIGNFFGPWKWNEKVYAVVSSGAMLFMSCVFLYESLQVMILAY